MNHSASRHWKLPALAGLACLIASLLVVALTQAAADPKLVSRNSAGGAADANSTLPVGTALSRDGAVVAFGSQASNLPGGDGVTPQVYVRNMNARKTRLVSINAAREPAASFVSPTGISADGRFVGFSGLGAGLPGANGRTQVWVHDRKTRRTALASRTAGGEPGDSGSSGGTLSADGRWTAFDSSAANLPGGESGFSAVYLYERKRKRTLRVSRANGGAPASGYVYGQAISADGNRIAFYSDDGSLPGADGTTNHVYVRDRKRGRTILVDRAADGAVADATSGNASISANGRFVIFESQAANLPGAGASSNQVYVRDLKRGKTRLVGRNSAGQPQTGYAEFAHLSADGRFAQFVSPAANLPGGNGVTPQVYLRDLRRGKTRLVSKTASGTPADAEASDGSISANGGWVAFDSLADNLGGNTAVRQVFRAGPFR